MAASIHGEDPNILEEVDDEDFVDARGVPGTCLLGSASG